MLCAWGFMSIRLAKLLLAFFVLSFSLPLKAAPNFTYVRDTRETNTNQYYDVVADRLWSQVLQQNINWPSADSNCYSHFPFGLKSSATGGQSVARLPTWDEWTAMNTRDDAETSGISTTRNMWTSTRYYPPSDNGVKYYFHTPDKNSPAGYRERTYSTADSVCVTDLPKLDNNGVTDAPEFVRSGISATSTKTNIAVGISADYYDLNDDIAGAQLRYKEEDSSTWLTEDLSLVSHQFQKRTLSGANYSSSLSFPTPGSYQVQFRATSIDGASSSSSVWTSILHVVEVVKDGAVTAPRFAGGGKDLGLYSGDTFKLKVSFDEHDHDPYVVNPQMRMRMAGGTWQAAISMDEDQIGARYKTFKKSLVLNNPAGDYEVQFRATSTNEAGTETAQSNWSPTKSFEIIGITPPRFLSMTTSTNGNPIGSRISAECSFQEDDPSEIVSSTILEYRKDGGTWISKAMTRKSGGGFVYFSTFASSGEGAYDFRCKAQTTTTSGQTVWSDWSGIITKNWMTVVSDTKTLLASVLGNGKITSNPAGISCPSDCSENVTPNTNMELTATANVGSSFVRWEEGCSSRGSNLTCTIRMDLSRSVRAVFEENEVIPTKYQLSISKTGIGSALITSSLAGINCGTDCSEQYNEGTLITLTCVAESKSECKTWTGVSGCSGSQCQFTVTKNTNIQIKIDETIGTTNPVVTNITPKTAYLNEKTEFCFAGTNLRSGMGFHIDECAGKVEVSGSLTKRCWACIPSFTDGTKTGVIKDKPSGNKLLNFSVDISTKNNSDSLKALYEEQDRLKAQVEGEKQRLKELEESQNNVPNENEVAAAGNIFLGEAEKQIEQSHAAVSSEIKPNDPIWEKDGSKIISLHEGVNAYAYSPLYEGVPGRLQYLLAPKTIYVSYGTPYAENANEGKNYPALVWVEYHKAFYPNGEPFTSPRFIVKNYAELKETITDLQSFANSSIAGSRIPALVATQCLVTTSLVKKAICTHYKNNREVIDRALQLTIEEIMNDMKELTPEEKLKARQFITSIALDMTPYVGSIKSAGQLIIGRDLITNEDASRIVELIGIIPYAKVAIKAKTFKLGLVFSNKVLFLFVKNYNKVKNVGKYFDITGGRRNHILDNHRFGSGIPGKTEFPKGWSDDEIIHYVSDIASDPKLIILYEDKGSWQLPYIVGVRNGSKIRVDLFGSNSKKYGEISTAYTLDVTHNSY